MKREIMKRKITVVGAGNVGATAALYLAEKKLGDIVVVDVVDGLPQAKAEDLVHASAMRGYGNITITGANDYTPIKNSNIVIVTAGVARKPGMSRSDLLGVNAKIVGQVAGNIKEHAPNAIVIVVSNPLDVMCWVMLKQTGFPVNRIIGMAGVLDTCRFRYFIAEALGAHPSDVQAMVLGGHGDSMVPLPRYSTVSGVPITQLLPEDKINAMVDRARKGGGEIVSLLKTGSAFYAPAASAVEMAEAIIHDSKRILPCAVLLKGQHGINDVFVGVPVKLGREGVEQIYELKMDPSELKALQDSAAAVKADMDELDKL